MTQHLNLYIFYQNISGKLPKIFLTQLPLTSTYFSENSHRHAPICRFLFVKFELYITVDRQKDKSSLTSR